MIDLVSIDDTPNASHKACGVGVAKSIPATRFMCWHSKVQASHKACVLE